MQGVGMPPSSIPKDKDSQSSNPSSPKPYPAILVRNPSSSNNLNATDKPTISARTSFDPHTHSIPGTTKAGELSQSNPEDAEIGDVTTAETTTSLQAPFFTLINDTNPSSLNSTSKATDTDGGGDGDGEGITYHPSRIHYIFSDDDGSEALTAGLLKALEYTSDQEEDQIEDETSEADAESKGSSPMTTTATTTGSSSSSVTFKSPKSKTQTRSKKPKYNTVGKVKNREERVIIVDLNESADAVTSVSSLSPNWQVLNARIETAPTFDNTTNTSNLPAGQGLMLRIQGVGKLTSSSDLKEEGLGLGISAKEKKGLESSAVMGEEEMAALLEGFDKKMGVLRGIVGNEIPFLPGDGGDEDREQSLQPEDPDLGDEAGEHDR